MTLKTIFAILREARSIVKETPPRAKTDSDERAAIARAFNDRYTYRFKNKAADKHASDVPLNVIAFTSQMGGTYSRGRSFRPAARPGWASTL